MFHKNSLFPIIYVCVRKIEAFPGQLFTLPVTASDEFHFSTVSIVALIDIGAKVIESMRSVCGPSIHVCFLFYPTLEKIIHK